MEKVYLEAQKRDLIGKGPVKKIRAGGMVPAVICRRGQVTEHVVVNARELDKAVHTKAGENVLITLKVPGDGGGQEKMVIIKHLQLHPLKDIVLHVDFNEISLTETITLKVPVHLKGTAVGVKQENGVLEHLLWEVEVECLPTAIPERVDVDISPLKIGDSFFVRDIKAPEGVTILTSAESIVVAVKHPHVETPVEPGEEGPAEPEVIREKKDKAEGEEEEPEAEKKDKKDKEK